MHVVIGELNDGSNNLLLFIVMQLYSKILHEIGGCMGNLLDYKVHKWILQMTFSGNLDA